MTQEEFNVTQFGKGMRCKHPRWGEGSIVGLDFDEQLIEVQFDENLGPDWVRCENVELIKPSL